MRRAIAVALVLVSSCISHAHEIRPAYLEIEESADHSLLITWKQPVMGELTLPLRPSMTAGWLNDSLAERTITDSYLIERWHIRAPYASLNKQTIVFEGLENTMTDALVEIVLADGQSYTFLVKPIKPFIKLDISKPQSPPVWQYIQLGVFHIWTGFDHLLFLLGLLLLVKNRKRLFWTITAFTIAHSITLALATLHVVVVSSVFTESAIALSIAFLAVELMNHHNGKDGLTVHYPWLVSFLFGLFHGLGFASALSNVGLPQNDIPMALFLFNVGVEMGQLVFVLAALVIGASIKLFRLQFPRWAYGLPAYTIGTLAMYWFIQRLAGAF